MKIVLFIIGLMVSAPAFAQHPAITDKDFQRNNQAIHDAMKRMNDPAIQQQMQGQMKMMQGMGYDMGGMNAADAGSVLQASLEINTCLQNEVGPERLNMLSAETKAMRRQVNAMCASGQKALAEKTQAEFAQKTYDSKTGKALRECSKKFETLMENPQMAAYKAQIEAMDPEKKRPACEG